MRLFKRYATFSYSASLITAAIVLLNCGAISAAQIKDESTAQKLVLQPAAEPKPALKYQLLPGFLDQLPGNAASDYMRLVIQWQNKWQDADNEKLDEQLAEWLKKPLEELPKDEVRAMLQRRKLIWEGLVKASRRETCKWDYHLRETNDPFSILIPELAQMRNLARFVALKARLEIAEGQLDEAIKTLQTGYAMARHVSEAPFFISALVGMAISEMMTDQVEKLIARPGRPNMYWALTNLPRPIISIRKVANVEKDLLYLMTPELREIDKNPSTAEYWRAAVDRIAESGLGYLWSGDTNKKRNRLKIIALVAKEYPFCKRALIDSGLSPERVEAMPVAQVVVMYQITEFNEIRDDLFKWFGLPYWQAEKGLEEAEKSMALSKRQGTFSLARMLLPALGRCKLAEAGAERSIALLRTVEALRIYAAANEGQLPNTLTEITVVPLPIDPMTGKSFQYKLEGDTAVIEAQAPTGTSKKRYAKTLEIKIAN